MTNQNIELDQYISKCQPNEYIMGASNEKAPGEPQIPAEALKRAPPSLTQRRCSSNYFKIVFTDKLTLKKPASDTSRQQHHHHHHQQEEQEEPFLQQQSTNDNDATMQQ
jgi:hypothetical protein